MKVLVLGAGKMTEAILFGLKDEADLSQYSIFSPSGKSAEELAKKVGARFVKSLDEVSNPDMVWVGCKPQQLKSLSESLGGRFAQATFVSMLAALPEKQQLDLLKASKLVRIMPNLSVRFKKGVTLLSSESAPNEMKIIKGLFSLLGLARSVTEDELEELTLLTGSGPALFYEFTKILAGSFTSLDPQERENLARMVLLGSGISAEKNPEGLNVMIDAVTSKGGVTIAVLEEWRKLGQDKLIASGIEAGKKRTAEIKELLLRS